MPRRLKPPSTLERSAEAAGPTGTSRSEDADFVLELVDQLFGDFGWRAFEELGLLRLLRDVKSLDLLTIVPDGGGDFVPGDLAQRLVFCLLDSDQGRVTQLVDAGLDGEYRW